MFLQVYRYFFCRKTNRRSLRWVEIGICIGRESSNVLNKICLFESCTFSLWYSLNHLKVLEKNSFDSWQYKKVCSIESGLRQKGHLSSEANLYFSSSFFVVIILCTTLKVNCLSLLSFEVLYIFTKQSPQFGSSEKLFFQAFTAEGSETSFSMNRLIIFTAEFGQDYCSIFYLTVLWSCSKQIRNRGTKCLSFQIRSNGSN